MKDDDRQRVVSDVDLLRPADGSVTGPLQQHTWPPDAEPSGERNAEAEAALRWDALEATEEDRSFPRPITFAWRAPPGHDGALRYDLSISRTADFSDARRVEDLTATEVDILERALFGLQGPLATTAGVMGEIGENAPDAESGIRGVGAAAQEMTPHLEALNDETSALRTSLGELSDKEHIIRVRWEIANPGFDDPASRTGDSPDPFFDVRDGLSAIPGFT